MKEEQSINIDTNNKNSNSWNFLDNLDLKKNNKFYIDDKEENFYHEINLYKKRHNLHIFSCCSNQMFDYFGYDYYFFLVWINNINVYCIIQNNEKKNKIKETYNNKYMEQKSFENMLDGLFSTKPIYYLDSTSRCKSIKNLEKLPLKPYKVIVVEDNTNDSTEINGYKIIPHKLLEYVPI